MRSSLYVRSCPSADNKKSRPAVGKLPFGGSLRLDIEVRDVRPLVADSDRLKHAKSSKDRGRSSALPQPLLLWLHRPGAVHIGRRQTHQRPRRLDRSL